HNGCVRGTILFPVMLWRVGEASSIAKARAVARYAGDRLQEQEAVRAFYDSESEPVQEKPETMDMCKETVGGSSVGDDGSEDSMGDDSSLRESLQGALSSRNANSPLELCLKAPPQAELEQLLGFSLDPATYKRILRQDGGEKQKHPESRVEQDAAPKEAEGAATEGTLDLMNQLAALDPPELAMPVQPVPETLNEPEAALADEKPARTPEKPPAPIGLAAQLSAMDPKKLRQVLAIVNQLQTSQKNLFEAETDAARRKLNFDANSDGEGSAPDCVDTQSWEVEPADYVQAWLQSARAEHQFRLEESIAAKKAEDREREALRAARAAERDASRAAETEASKAAEREASKAAEREAEESARLTARITKREPLSESVESAAALVVTRQAQLALTAKKKAKAPAEMPVPEDEVSEDKPQLVRKAKGKSDGSDSTGKVVGGKPKPGSLKRKLSKRSLLRNKKLKKASGKADAPDDATVYYSDEEAHGADDAWEEPQEWEWTAEEWAAWEAQRAEAPSKRVRQKSKQEEEPMPDGDADEDEDEEADENAIIFARRYCPSRPWFKAKFWGIKEAYDARIRPFVKVYMISMVLQDFFWKYVAQATSEEPVEDEKDWPTTASQLTLPFLLDDDVSKKWTQQGEKLFGKGKKPTRKQYETAIKKCVFILAVLCLLFNERLSSEREFVFLEHYAGHGAMSREISKAYTTTFGQRMAELLPSFNESPALRPSSMVDSLTIAKLQAMSMGTDDWCDAGVPDLLRYVYGAKGLNIPQDLTTAISVAEAEMKTEPATDSQLDQTVLKPVKQEPGVPQPLQRMDTGTSLPSPTSTTPPPSSQAHANLQQELIYKMEMLKATVTAQQEELLKLRSAQPSQAPEVPAKADKVPKTGATAGCAAQVVESPTPRGSKRSHPITPSTTPTKPNKPDSRTSKDNPAQADSDDDEPPKVLNFADMTKLEKEKVRRIVSPKKGTGNLEVPENIFEMWKSAGSSRDKLARIEKIVAWAEKKGLVRTCEYDDETLEYWVNTRTSGTLTKEDLEQLERKQKFEGEGGDEVNFNPAVQLDGFSFDDDDSMIHKNPKNLEGDQHKSALGLHVYAASQMKEHMKHVLKAKNSLDGFVDKIRPSVSGDSKATQTLKKMDALIKEYEILYEEMAELQAEGGAGGYTQKPVTAHPGPESGQEGLEHSILDERLISETAVASRILWHCVNVINAVRREHGGDALCVFKIGLTSDPFQRRRSYEQQNFKAFVVLHKVSQPELLGMMEMLEAALIAEFHDNERCCRNKQLGGESMRKKDFSPRFPPPYFAYCVPAKDLVMDAQAAIKKDACEVLAKIAKVQLSCADAPLYEILSKTGMTLPIDFSWTPAGNTSRYPFLKPKTVLETLSDHGRFHRVLGVPVHLASEALDLFWQKFRALHPKHDIFENSENRDFQKLIPYYLHGDGGRGYKKEAIEILSMFPALGTGSRKRPVDLSYKRTAAAEMELGINLQGSSGATRFLFSVVSSLVAKKDGNVFDDLLRVWSRELMLLFDDGFQVAGSTWRIAILGFTGDSPFVKKVAKTTRSFHNTRKTHSSRNLQKGCCWLCHAGYESPEDGIHFPFEHIGFTQPLWLQTTRLRNPLPWDGTGGPLQPNVLLDRADTPAAFYRADFFHVWHAGVGLDFTSSALIYSMRVVFGLGGVQRDLNALNECLKSWSARTKNRLYCGRLTEDLLGYNGTREYPEGKWSKNMDTATVMKFLVYFLERPESQQKLQADDILQDILVAAKDMGQAIRISLQAELFMSSEDTRSVVDCGHKFLMGYSVLVTKCYERSLCLFKLRPKVHYLNHIFLRCYEEFRAAGFATNILAESTFMSEDFVGRAARLSRRVSTRAVAVKTLQRYLLHMKSALDKEAFSMMDLSMFG
ncbi:unnamed protein product, partial [Symbiodinium sp. CCMP2456]